MLEFLKKFFRSPVVGVVDTHRARTISGWAIKRRDDVPVTVDFFVDGRLAGSTKADGYRPDLLSQSPHGRCAFQYSIPAQYLDGAEHRIEVRAGDTARPLTNGSFTVRLHPPEHYEPLIVDIVKSGLWALTGAPADGGVQFSGWTLCPSDCDARIFVNGRPAEVKMDEGSADWKSPLPPHMVLRSFRGVTPLEPGWRELHFSFGGEQPLHPLRDYHYPLFPVAMPDAERRVRVAGHSSEFLFDLEGYTIAKKLDVLAQRFTGRPLAGLGPVLDWGCGCGRTARYLAHQRVELHGADIDADNVRWCSQHIEGRFTAIHSRPPTPFPQDFFGVIYGISVFTHLTQEYETLWLAELHRIARPGALLFLSVLGNVAAARENLLEQIVSDEEGFVDLGRNPGIDAVTQGSDYYRNVFHRRDYISRAWGKYFEILSIAEGIVGNYQDLVVARKRASSLPSTE